MVESWLQALSQGDSEHVLSHGKVTGKLRHVMTGQACPKNRTARTEKLCGQGGNADQGRTNPPISGSSVPTAAGRPAMWNLMQDRNGTAQSGLSSSNRMAKKPENANTTVR